jgi:hypothetical protein
VRIALSLSRQVRSGRSVCDGHQHFTEGLFIVRSASVSDWEKLGNWQRTLSIPAVAHVISPFLTPA